MIYKSTDKGPYRMPGYHDPDTERTIGITYRPPVWTNSTVYYLRAKKDYDTVIPTVFTGVYYKVKQPGKSGTVEPTWVSTIGEETVDGSVIWEAVSYNLLPPGINVSTSVWSVSPNTITLDSEANSTSYTTVQINPLPAGVTSFVVTNRVTFSDTTKSDVSILFKVGEH